MRSRRLSGGLALLLALGLCGCGTTRPLGRLFGKDEFPKATAENPVVELVSIWQPAEGTGLDGLPTRGFAGQLLFFTRGSEKPCQVNGAVRVYLFENTGPVSERVKPIHQFDFSPESWNAYLHEGTLGATYQLFVPYPKRNPHQTSCSLRVRFEPVTGPRVFSDSVNVTLPGPVLEEEQAVFTTPRAGGPSMRSLSIPLRPNKSQSPHNRPASVGAANADEPTSAAPNAFADEPARGMRTADVRRAVTTNRLAGAPPATPLGDTEADPEADRLREIEAKLAKLLAERSAAIHAAAARHAESQPGEDPTSDGSRAGSRDEWSPDVTLAADAEAESASPQGFRLSRDDAPPRNPLADPPEPGRHDFNNVDARPATFDALLEEHAPRSTTPHPLAE